MEESPATASVVDVGGGGFEGGESSWTKRVWSRGIMSNVCGEGKGPVFVLAASWLRDSGDEDVVGRASGAFAAGAVTEVGVLEDI